MRLKRPGPRERRWRWRGGWREWKEDVHGPHDQVVGLPAVIPGDGAEEAAGKNSDSHRDETHLEGNPGSVDDAAEDIPAQLVGAEEMGF
jgi:hypothetical protein